MKISPTSKRLGKTKWGAVLHFSGTENAFLSISIALQDLVSHFALPSVAKRLS